MDEQTHTFESEPLADAFIQGLEAAMTLADNDHISYEKLVDNDEVTVVVSYNC